MILPPILPNNLYGGIDEESYKIIKSVLIFVIMFSILSLMFAIWGSFIRPDGQSNAEWFINEFILMHRWFH